MALSQNELVKKTKTFTTNGVLPAAQALLNGIGYDPPTLATGSGYADAVLTGQAETQAAKSEQTKATKAEKAARTAAQKEATTLSETARVLFAGDASTLLALGLQTHHETITDPETGETRQVAVRLPRGTADVIAHWNTLFDNAGRLAPSQQAALSATGWPASRLTAGKALVTAYAQADIAQQAAIQAYQARSEQHKTDVETLRKWYAKASNLAKITIKSADPANSGQVLELLGLA